MYAKNYGMHSYSKTSVCATEREGVKAAAGRDDEEEEVEGAHPVSLKSITVNEDCFAKSTIASKSFFSFEKLMRRLYRKPRHRSYSVLCI